ncbi:MAG: DUF1844 domain-containing protein [Planctomycetia bacterium]|nr:DUF1844 domain-containing protein [Planctomycetia bacterium]MBL6915430.1 DUF1844 domain-containing protein [Planctomycetota bacterium]
MSDNKRIDDDWKKRAFEEKQKLASQMGGIVEETADSADSEERAPIESDPRFPGLVQQIAYPALMALGQIPDPRTGERMLDLNLARDTIDLLGVLDAKTEGNLSNEEDEMIKNLLRDLHVAYTQVAAAENQAAMDSEADSPSE